MKLKLHSENCHVWESSSRTILQSPKMYRWSKLRLLRPNSVFFAKSRNKSWKEVLLRSWYVPCLKVKMIYVLDKTIYNCCFCTCFLHRSKELSLFGCYFVFNEELPLLWFFSITQLEQQVLTRRCHLLQEKNKIVTKAEMPPSQS